MAKKTAKSAAKNESRASAAGSSRELRELQREHKRMVTALRKIEALAGRIITEVKTSVPPTTILR